MNTPPGVFSDMSHAEYLNTDGWVSSSQLKRHLPEWFKPFNGSPSADIGSVLHARFTGDETPVTVVDAATWTGKAAKETRETVTAAGGYSILAADQISIDGMEAALRGHSVAHRLLVEASGAWEVSVFAEVDGVPSKARFDRLLDDGTAVDVKTTKEQPNPRDLARAVVNYGYDIQRVHYDYVADAAGIELDRPGFKFVFVQNVEPYAVTVCELDSYFWDRGEQLRDLALQRWLHPSMTEAYPGEREPVTLAMPGWAAL